MDLRLYTKSGNNYYVDISEYNFNHILEVVTNAMDRGNILTLENGNQVDVIDCKQVEYFEIIKGEEETEEFTLEEINKFIRG